ncbi:MAG: group III truncated hemoglobin [Alcanivoracaceae bacterium]|nr:group III truncated hemoglobin [Alcanivoracaceae bacterium]
MTIAHQWPPAGGRPSAHRRGLPDLDTAEHIDRFVHLFYQRLLADPSLAPYFTEVAGISLEAHLPLISAYWRKMLLGEAGYQRHTMARHRQLHARRALGGAQHEAWLGHFFAVAEAHFSGPKTDRARHIAARVMDNLYQQLATLPGGKA